MNINIKIPTSLKDITLRQYKKYLKIQDTVKDPRFLNAKMIEILCKVRLEDVMLLRLSDSQEIISKLSSVFDQKPALVNRFMLNKVDYGFHPELDSLTLGEYIDLDRFIGDWENMEKAMNVLYRPVVVKLKERYSIEEYKLGTDAVLLDMPMDAVMSSIFFFWNLGLELSKTMTNSLDNKETEILTQYLNSQENGVGINHFMDSLRGTLQDLKISLN
jgi:hypothetical protein